MPEDEHDTPTLLAIALVAYAVTAVVHEGLGHGGACLLVGGAPDTLNSCYFECRGDSLSSVASRWISSGGTLANLVFAGLSWGALAALRTRARPATVYFWWFFFTVNVLTAFGYLMFSGMLGIGDWAKVVEGREPQWLWRTGLALLGTALYFGPGRALVWRGLEPFVGSDEKRVRRTHALALWPYLAGGLQSVLAGALNPESPMLVLISAAAASLGGTSLLAWYPRLAARLGKQSGAPPVVVPRSNAWLAAGALVSVVFIVVLGRGIRF